MDKEDNYEKETATRVFMKHGYAVGGSEDEVEEESFSLSKDGDGLDEPPVLSPPHTMDILSVRRPPVPVMVSADQISAHVLSLALLAVVDRELFHIIKHFPSFILK